MLLAIPGVLMSAAVVAVVLTLATGLPIGLCVHRRRHGVGHGSGGGRRHLQAPPRATGPVDDGRWREPAQRRHRARPVRASRSRRSPRRSDRARPSSPSWPRSCSASRSGSAPAISRRVSIGLVDDHLIELTISVVLAYGSYIARGPAPPVRRHRDGRRRPSCSAMLGPGRTMSATGDGRDRHRLGVRRLPAHRGRLPRGGPGHLARSPARLDRADRVGHRRDPRRPRGGRLRPARRGLAPHAHARGWPNASQPAGSTSCSGRVCAGRSRSRWPCRCRSTSRSATCSRRSPSASSCSPCWCRARPSAR